MSIHADLPDGTAKPGYHEWNDILRHVRAAMWNPMPAGGGLDTPHPGTSARRIVNAVPLKVPSTEQLPGVWKARILMWCEDGAVTITPYVRRTSGTPEYVATGDACSGTDDDTFTGTNQEQVLTFTAAAGQRYEVWAERSASTKDCYISATWERTNDASNLSVLPSTPVLRYALAGPFTDAQVKALPTTPLELVPAQGAGTLILPSQIGLFGKFASGAYGNISDQSYITAVMNGVEGWAGYIPNSAAHSLAKLTEFLGAQNRYTALLPYFLADLSDWGQSADPVAYGSAVNEALELSAFNSGGDFTGGHGSNALTVLTTFVVVAVP